MPPNIAHTRLFLQMLPTIQQGMSRSSGRPEGRERGGGEEGCRLIEKGERMFSSKSRYHMLGACTMTYLNVTSIY